MKECKYNWGDMGVAVGELVEVLTLEEVDVVVVVEEEEENDDDDDDDDELDDEGGASGRGGGVKSWKDTDIASS